GIGAWPQQLTVGLITNGVPVRLSSFTVHAVTVDYSVSSSTSVIASGTLEFFPGETVKKIVVPPALIQGIDALQVTLSSPTGGELTGDSRIYLTSPASTPVTPVTIVKYGEMWKYLDDGSNQGTGWRNPGFNDSAWLSGLAELGFGDNDEATTIRSNRTDTSRIATYYFRRSVSVEDPSQFGSYTLSLRRDDAGVVYFNGTDVFRSPNLPAGELASTFVTG